MPPTSLTIILRCRGQASLQLPSAPVARFLYGSEVIDSTFRARHDRTPVCLVKAYMGNGVCSASRRALPLNGRFVKSGQTGNEE
jgi:hypothetical protein